jgi:plastocyanin
MIALIMLFSGISSTQVPSLNAQSRSNVTTDAPASNTQGTNVITGGLIATVIISGFAFHPQDIYITIGTTVTWTNNDPVLYTLWFVTAENQTTYLLSNPIAPNSSWSYTFSEPIHLQYYSFDRLWITGNVTVTISSVGGVVVSVDKFGLLAPYIALVSTILVATAATALYAKRRKKQ